MSYDILTAHADGRHASTHPDDVSFWQSQGCTGCLDRTPPPDAVISECRGRVIWDIPTPNVRIGDVLPMWLSDATAYVTVTGWEDVTYNLTAHGLGITTHRVFTVDGAPWWVDKAQRTNTLVTHHRTWGRTFILPR